MKLYTFKKCPRYLPRPPKPLLIMLFTSSFIGMTAQAKTAFREPVPGFAKGFRLNIDITGRVTDASGNPLHGATIGIKGSSRKPVITDADGSFTLKKADENATLIISYLGYAPKEVKAARQLGNIVLTEIDVQLQEVGIVSTGYQQIPKERATGSFVLVDSALLNRRVGSTVLDRLDGITSGLVFNRQNSAIQNVPDISIRGRSTISSNPNPLIILDNFPYDGDLSNINPQDIKSITVLKDGAATSIWGSRAGNGVIVMTTYKGTFGQQPAISLNTNVSIGSKPDQFFQPQLTNKQFIGVEQFLFDQGAYNNTINNGYGALSPAVEIMLQRRNGIIKTDQERNAQLDALAEHDNRNDLDQYFYRRSISQQYQMNLSGGGRHNKYYVSLGYDKNLSGMITKSNDRLTLNVNNTVSFLNNKMELFTGVLFTSSKNTTKGSTYTPLYPYENIRDQNGNPAALSRTLRLSFADTVGNGRLLDWHYKPLDEVRNPQSVYTTKLTDYRLSTGIRYNIMKNLNFTLNYSYDKGINENSDYNTIDSYSTRDLINTYTQINPVNGVITYPIPLGDIAGNSTTSYFSHYGRGQFSFENTFSKKHMINAIAGFEVKSYEDKFAGLTLYGYNKETGTNGNSAINPLMDYPAYYGFSSSRIPLNIANSGTIDRYRSYFANASYQYDNQYILSGSARRDESNLFGVKTNQKGVLLWSAGLAWNISKAPFYNVDGIPYLKIRTTYGYSGNVNKKTSAYLTATAVANNPYGQPYSAIENPPNPSLRWEQVRNINIGLDFQTKSGILSGSLEYYIKEGLDLIGTAPIAQQTGVSVFTGNSANIRGQGLDLLLNSTNLKSGQFQWSSNLQFNYNSDKITAYKVKQTNNLGIVSNNYLQPLEGYSYYALFSYKWKGLNNQGNPQGLLNGLVSTDYAAIANSNDASAMVYRGNVLPKYFGNLMNIFSYGPFEVSINLAYKFDFVYRRNSLQNANLYNAINTKSQYQQADYELRWQKPGDELKTNVPALIYPAISLRDSFYNFSDILVEKADNIRVQDVKLAYKYSRRNFRGVAQYNLSAYVYSTNLGILWKASSYRNDPEAPNNQPKVKVVSVGIKADFK